jgi:hypothetical protein
VLPDVRGAGVRRLAAVPANSAGAKGREVGLGAHTAAPWTLRQRDIQGECARPDGRPSLRGLFWVGNAGGPAALGAQPSPPLEGSAPSPPVPRRRRTQAKPCGLLRVWQAASAGSD